MDRGSISANDEAPAFAELRRGERMTNGEKRGGFYEPLVIDAPLAAPSVTFRMD
jgi:hypothetical protein